MATIITNLGSALARSAKIFRGNSIATSSCPTKAIERPRRAFAAVLLKALSVSVA